MAAELMELTNVYLDRRKKLALKELARVKGTNLAEEIRSAIDAYLSGVTPDELELLDAATKHAQTSIAEMSDLLDATNRKADRIFSELERLRGGRPVEASNHAEMEGKNRGTAH